MGLLFCFFSTQHYVGGHITNCRTRWCDDLICFLSSINSKDIRLYYLSYSFSAHLAAETTLHQSDGRSLISSLLAQLARTLESKLSITTGLLMRKHNYCCFLPFSFWLATFSLGTLRYFIRSLDNELGVTASISCSSTSFMCKIDEAQIS